MPSSDGTGMAGPLSCSPGRRAKQHPAPQLQRAHSIVARIILAAVPVQMVMLFLGLPLGVHRILGAAIGLAALLLSLMAVAGRLSRITRALSNALLLLLIVQPVCVLFGEQIPTLMALHGVNAFLILVLVVVLVLHLEEETAGSRDESWRSPSAP